MKTGKKKRFGFTSMVQKYMSSYDDYCESIVSTGHSLVDYKEMDDCVFLLFENRKKGMFMVVKAKAAIGAGEYQLILAYF